MPAKALKQYLLYPIHHLRPTRICMEVVCHSCRPDELVCLNITTFLIQSLFPRDHTPGWYEEVPTRTRSRRIELGGYRHSDPSSTVSWAVVIKFKARLTIRCQHPLWCMPIPLRPPEPNYSLELLLKSASAGYRSSRPTFPTKSN
jgi:hypothetical protein